MTPIAGAGVGIDVGGTSTRVVVFGADDAVVHTARSATARGAAALLEHLVRQVQAAIDASGVVPATIGIGIPGTVRGGEVSMALNIGIHAPLPLASALQNRFGVPVHVENDVNAAAFGAHVHLGATAGLGDLVLVSIGTGLAAGTVVDGHVVGGAFGTAGEIGHIAVPGRDERCACGQHGCLEAIASGSAIVERMRAAGLDGGAIELWDAADDGQPAATAIRDDVVATLAWAVQAVCLLLDVGRVVLAGGVAIALGDRLTVSIADALDQQASRSAWLTGARIATRVVPAPAGVELGALGAHRAAQRGLPIGRPR